jgi:hypothetical protein
MCGAAGMRRANIALQSVSVLDKKPVRRNGVRWRPVMTMAKSSPTSEKELRPAPGKATAES